MSRKQTPSRNNLRLRRRRQAIQRHLLKLQRESQTKHVFQPLTLSWKTISACATILGIVAFAFFFIPRVTLEIGPSLDPNAPFKNVIYLCNNGYFPIKNIQCTLGNVHIETIDGDVPVRNLSLAGWRGLNISEIQVDHKVPLTMNHSISFSPGLIGHSKVNIGVTFELWPSTTKISKTFPLRTEKTHDNKLIWVYSQFEEPEKKPKK